MTRSQTWFVSSVGFGGAVMASGAIFVAQSIGTVISLLGGVMLGAAWVLVMDRR